MVEEEIRWAAVKGQEDEEVKKVKVGQPRFLDTCVVAAGSSVGHLTTSSLRPAVTQDSSTLRERLLISCVFTHKNVLIFVCPHYIFFCFLCFVFFCFLTHFLWEICGFKMAGQTEVPPLLPLLDT